MEIEPLQIKQSDLNTKRMLDLMAVSQDEGPMPLYLHTVNRILRELRIQQQEAGGTFDYQGFKQQIVDAGLSPTQLGPLNQRLDTLESFMSIRPTKAGRKKGSKEKASGSGGTLWDSKVRRLEPRRQRC